VRRVVRLVIQEEDQNGEFINHIIHDDLRGVPRHSHAAWWHLTQDIQHTVDILNEKEANCGQPE
jgi:hypothetical protein